MILRHLKIFVAVCETGSVTSAGERLYIAQPSVSLAISELEEYYGIKLFDRIAKRLHITETGKQFLQYATHIVALFDELEHRVKNFDAIGILRVGSSITIGNYLLPNYVKAFEAAHTQMKIHVTIDNSQSIEEKILNNQIDIALIEGFTHSPYIKTIKLLDDELVFICSIEHTLRSTNDLEIMELKNENFVLREKGSAVREIIDGIFALHGIDIMPTWESVSTQAIIRAVSAGLGISVLPYLLVKDSLERKEINTFSIKDVSLKRQFFIIYHKNKYLTQSAKDFINLCK